MSWFLPLDAVTLWASGAVMAIFFTISIVSYIKSRQEAEWPEVPGEVIGYVERPVEDDMQHVPTLRILEPCGLPEVVTTTRSMSELPELGSRWTVKYHPEGKIIWIKGVTPGTMRKVSMVFFGLGLFFPLAVLPFIDWSA